MAHVPGETIAVKVERFGNTLAVKAQLTTRDALLHNMIGKPMVETDLVGVEDGASYDLSSLHGQMAIVLLYNPACADCASLFGKFLDWARDRARRDGPQPLVLAVCPSAEPTHDLRTLQKTLDVPLAVGEFAPGGKRRLAVQPRPPDLGSRPARVLVLDGRGIVQYLGPIAPNSDDTEAVLDELFAAADQAWRHSR